MKIKIFDLTIIIFILFLIGIFVWNGIKPNVREIKVRVEQGCSNDDLELILIARSISYNYSFANKVPIEIKNLSFPLKFKIVSRNTKETKYLSQNSLLLFENIHIVHETLVVMKKEGIDIMSSFSEPLPLAYKNINRDQIKVIYYIAPEANVSSFTKAELKSGIKVTNTQVLKEEIELFIMSLKTSIP
jgi:hypothetical protein